LNRASGTVLKYLIEERANVGSLKKLPPRDILIEDVVALLSPSPGVTESL
jgi:hypothetical protein